VGERGEISVFDGKRDNVLSSISCFRRGLEGYAGGHRIVCIRTAGRARGCVGERGEISIFDGKRDNVLSCSSFLL
jgi:hypothetical protein